MNDTNENLLKGLNILLNLDKNIIIEAGEGCIYVSAPENLSRQTTFTLIQLGFIWKYDTFHFYVGCP